MKAVVVAFVLALVLLLPKVSAWAAPLPSAMNQTVPPPTPTNPVPDVPTATPVPNNDDDDDDNNNPTPIPTNPEAASTATPQPQPAALTATVNVARLNLREGPGTTYPAVGVITSGQSVQVLARNEFGDWWRVCCLSGTTTAGWVSSQYLLPQFDLGQVTVLVPLASGLPTPPPPTAVPTIDPAAVPTPTVTSGLQLQIRQEPLYTWQGQEVVLVYLIVNNGATVTDLQLRNELPPQLRFVGVEEWGGGTVTTENENAEAGPAVFTIQWPELAATGRAEVQVRVRVAQELPDGAVIDNLAVLTAQDVAALTAGISIGMPPRSLPEFR